MGMFVNAGRRAVYASVAVVVAAAGLGLAAFPAGATQGQSQLQISSDSAMAGAVVDLGEIDLSSNSADLNHSAIVYTQLDSNCPNVFVDPSGKPNAGQKYSIGTSFNPATNSATPPATIASVAPSNPTGLICSTITAFTITGLAPGTTTLSFTPVATNRGLQRKLSDVPATVLVVVDGGGQQCDPQSDPNCNPQQGSRPAAPAVANMLIDGNYLGAPDVATACKAYFHNAKSWRGSTISNVAAIMPLPESVKDDLSVYPTFADWENEVLDLLSATCGTSFPHV